MDDLGYQAFASEPLQRLSGAVRRHVVGDYEPVYLSAPTLPELLPLLAAHLNQTEL